MTARPQDVALLWPKHMDDRIARLKSWSDQGQYRKIPGPPAGEAFDLAVELEQLRANLSAALASAQAREEELRRERDEARGLVIEANNSLFGSQGYFHSMNGGAYDRHNLSRAIEDLKARSRRVERLAEALRSARSLLSGVEGISRNNLEQLAHEEVEAIDTSLSTNAAQPGETT